MIKQPTGSSNPKPLVTVGVCTYKRVHTLPYLFEALKKQTYKNFEIVIALKPSGDGTEKILEKNSKELSINIAIQTHDGITNAYNIIIDNAKGEIIVFVDDDAVPYPNWLEEYVMTYQKYDNLGAVSGPAESAILENEKVTKATIEVAKNVREYELPWARPLKGMSDWLIYFGKDGLVHHRQMLKKGNVDKVYPSLLFMGANMSFKTEAIKGITFDEENFLGFTCEQRFAYKILLRGYKMVFNPNARVLHILQDDTLGRFYTTPKKAALRDAEFVASFPFVRPTANVSFFAYVLSIFTIIFAYVLKTRKYGLFTVIYRVYGLMYGFVVACSIIVSTFFGGNFSKLNALSKIYD